MKSKVTASRVLIVVGLVAAMFTVSRPSLNAIAFGSSGAIPSGRQLTRLVAALRVPRTGRNARFGHENVTIREAVLADVHEASQTGQDARLEWVMSIMPANGTQNAADGVVQVKYMVAFVSATHAQNPIYTISAGVPINAPVACCDTGHAVDAQP